MFSHHHLKKTTQYSKKLPDSMILLFVLTSTCRTTLCFTLKTTSLFSIFTVNFLYLHSRSNFIIVKRKTQSFQLHLTFRLKTVSLFDHGLWLGLFASVSCHLLLKTLSPCSFLTPTDTFPTFALSLRLTQILWHKYCTVQRNYSRQVKPINFLVRYLAFAVRLLRNLCHRLSLDRRTLFNISLVFSHSCLSTKTLFVRLQCFLKPHWTCLYQYQSIRPNSLSKLWHAVYQILVKRFRNCLAFKPYFKITTMHSPQAHSPELRHSVVIQSIYGFWPSSSFPEVFYFSNLVVLPTAFSEVHTMGLGLDVVAVFFSFARLC